MTATMTLEQKWANQATKLATAEALCELLDAALPAPFRSDVHVHSNLACYMILIYPHLSWDEAVGCRDKHDHLVPSVQAIVDRIAGDGWTIRHNQYGTDVFFAEDVA